MFSYVPLLWNQSGTPPKRHCFLMWYSACFQCSMETQVRALSFLKNENWWDISSTCQHWWCSKRVWLFNEIHSFFIWGWHPQLANKLSLLNSISLCMHNKNMWDSETLFSSTQNHLILLFAFQNIMLPLSSNLHFWYPYYLSYDECRCSGEGHKC